LLLKYSEGPTSLNQNMAFVNEKLDKKVNVCSRNAACFCSEFGITGGVASLGGLSMGSPVSVNQIGLFVNCSYSLISPFHICWSVMVEVTPSWVIVSLGSQAAPVLSP